VAARGRACPAFRAEQEAAVPAPKAAVVETRCSSRPAWMASYDRTVAIVADETVRASAPPRAGTSRRRAAARQLTQDEKARRATFVCANDGSEADLRAPALVDVLGKLGAA